MVPYYSYYHDDCYVRECQWDEKCNWHFKCSIVVVCSHKKMRLPKVIVNGFVMQVKLVMSDTNTQRIVLIPFLEMTKAVVLRITSVFTSAQYT